jgi:hypothetical protein
LLLLFYHDDGVDASALPFEEEVIKNWLGNYWSWVQLPPGPFLSVVQLRYWFEFDFGDWRTNSAAMA